MQCSLWGAVPLKETLGAAQSRLQDDQQLQNDAACGEQATVEEQVTYQIEGHEIKGIVTTS